MTFEFKDGIALLGIVGSLAVGVRNWIVTASIRSGTIRLEEFRSQIRDPFQKKIDKLAEVREALVALQRPNALDDEELRDKISEQVATFEFAVQDLGDLCDHADRSSFAQGRNWRARYAQKLEDVVGKLGGLTAAGGFDRMTAGGTLTDAVRAITDVSGELRLRFEHEVRDLVPDGVFGGLLGRAKGRR